MSRVMLGYQHNCGIQGLVLSEFGRSVDVVLQDGAVLSWNMRDVCRFVPEPDDPRWALAAQRIKDLERASKPMLTAIDPAMSTKHTDQRDVTIKSLMGNLDRERRRAGELGDKCGSLKSQLDEANRVIGEQEREIRRLAKGAVREAKKSR